MANVATPGTIIGIIGGSYLSRMLALSAKKMGYQVAILDPDSDCPAAQLADVQIVGEINDQEKLTQLAFKCDLVTMEADFLYPESARRVARTAAFPQGMELLDVSQDRILEKAYLEAGNFNIAPYATVVTPEDIKTFSGELGFPCILKTLHRDKKKKQEVILYSEEDFNESEKLLAYGTCILEALIPFERQLSISVVRNAKGELHSFPITENMYRGDLLYESILPARISGDVADEVNRIAEVIAQRSELVGSMTIELLYTASGALYIDEITPTIHDSGLATIDSCSTSLFDAHIRAICGWSLPEIKLHSKSITVKVTPENQQEAKNQFQLKPDWYFYFYGSRTTTKQQPLGHITVLTEQIEATHELLNDAGVIF